MALHDATAVAAVVVVVVNLAVLWRLFGGVCVICGDMMATAARVTVPQGTAMSLT
jgi:hypothetical protein